MTLLLISFLAGVLTILAPCILPLLPIIIGGSLAGDHKVAWKRTLLIIGSLSVSVIVFTLLLRASTALLGVPQETWQIVSGSIVILLGLNFVFPHIWTSFVARFQLQQKTDVALGSATKRDGFVGAIFTGAALGPVFTSCSPTYFLILATILPVSFGLGLLYLTAYTLGMAAMLLLVAYFGRTIIRKLGWTTDETGWFRRTLGVLFIIVGVSILLGWDKDLQAWLLERGVYDGTTGLENFFDL